jgi:hypothetical protein
MSSPLKDFCLLDFSFYHGIDSETVVVKELAAVCCSGDELRRQHWVFLPPYPKSVLSEEVRIKNAICQERYVTYAWDEGDVSYDRLGDILKSCTAKHDTVFVNGDERSFLVADLTDKTVRNFKTLYKWICYAGQVGALTVRSIDFASPCLKHTSEEKVICTKARATYLMSMCKVYREAIRNGKAKIELVFPNSNTVTSVPTKREREEQEQEQEAGIACESEDSFQYDQCG